MFLIVEKIWMKKNVLVVRMMFIYYKKVNLNSINGLWVINILIAKTWQFWRGFLKNLLWGYFSFQIVFFTFYRKKIKIKNKRTFFCWQYTFVIFCLPHFSHGWVIKKNKKQAGMQELLWNSHQIEYTERTIKDRMNCFWIYVQNIRINNVRITEIQKKSNLKTGMSP